MRIISFAYTTPALLAGASPDPAERALAKTVTRRAWEDSYAASFYPGEHLQAYDRSPRIGGRKVGVIKLLRRPVLESTAEMPDGDWVAEGFRFLHEHPECALPKKGFPQRSDLSWEGFIRWRAQSELLYVVRFQLVSVVPGVRVSYGPVAAPAARKQGVLL